jgi:hypothetical protein
LPPLAIGGKTTFATEPLRSVARNPGVPDALYSLLMEGIMKKFFVALLTVIALSGAVGAVLVAYPNSAAAHEEPPDPC